jgi:Protein of unknown function (DUF2652)
MTQPIPPGPASGPLLLADISGYTGFLQSVTTAHRDDAFADGRVPDAYGLVSSLLDGIIERIVPPFTLSKVEGDAVFAFARDDEGVPRGEALLGCLSACYAAFTERLGGAMQVWTCRCDACSRVGGLDLKFVLHAGSYVVQSVAGGRELVGPEVVMAHRLLKNHAAELIGHPAYALITEAAASRLGVPADGALELIESYEHYPPIAARVYSLG